MRASAGPKNEPATLADIAEMAKITKEAMLAGALGFSTSRTQLHRAKDGEAMPAPATARDEMVGIGRALAEAGHGVFEIAGGDEDPGGRVRLDEAIRQGVGPADHLRLAPIARRSQHKWR